MISNQLLQKTIDKLKSISGSDFTVYDLAGEILVRTDPVEREDPLRISEFAVSGKDSLETERSILFKVKNDSRIEFILAVNKAGANEMVVGSMARYQLETILLAYKERFDKDNFFKSLLMDNMLMIDIFDRAKKLHIDTEAYRAVMIIEIGNRRHGEIIELIRSLFTAVNDDFVTAINKKDIIVIKRTDSPNNYKQLDSTAEKIRSVIMKDGGDEVIVSYGTIVTDLKEVSMSYKEARMAMDVSRIFFPERMINPYNHLDIGRLIYQLPMPLCKLFIKETFDEVDIESLDEETVTTINKFFENSLNVSETSRQLYIHRNTLVYRLDKIEKLTGLDLRVFEDAITFKIALMVSKYMKYVESKK